MSRTLQFKRYANTAIANTTGANGELIIDTTNKTITVHDGTTVGGSRIATEIYVTQQINSNYSIDGQIFDKANSANVLAQSSFDKANTASSNTIYLQGALNTANTNINAAAQTFPQNAQTANYTLVQTDAGKHLYYTQATNVNLYIPWSSNVSFSNGTTIMVVSRTTAGANVTVTPNTGVTMYLAGNTTSASRNVITHGVATLLQVASNTWMIYGTGVL
jgi:hypothetical protein